MKRDDERLWCELAEREQPTSKPPASDGPGVLASDWLPTCLKTWSASRILKTPLEPSLPPSQGMAGRG
jgi:hypothetical protein